MQQIMRDDSFFARFPGRYLQRKRIDWFRSCRISSDPTADSRVHWQPSPDLCIKKAGCTYSKRPSSFLPGCANGCEHFSTLAGAQAACDAHEECGGVTETVSAHRAVWDWYLIRAQ